MSDLHAHSVAYVRDTMLPQADPPASETGAIGWLRENLFSGPLNTVLTILSLAAIVWLIQAIFPWFANSVWHADSLDNCREILDGTLGACFAVITERWRQMMYGFYPTEIYWRANFTLLLLFVALVPILFINLSARARAIVAATIFVLSGVLVWGSFWSDIGAVGAILLILLFAAFAFAIYEYDRTRKFLVAFSLLFPFLMIWLVWGGSIWGPVSALLGFVIIGLCAAYLPPVIGNLGATIVAVVGAVIWWLFIASAFSAAMGSILPFSIQAVESRALGGFMLSIIIGVSGIALSLPLGIVLALGRQSNLFIVHTLSVMFIEFIRGVPLITLLFTASLLLNYFLPPGTNFDILLRVIILVTLFAAAYNAETVRGGLAALPRGQYEGADSLGLDYWQSQRLIIMPQALKISIPGIVNNFIGLFKDTTLVTFIGLFDILNFTNAIRANAEWHGIYWELYIFVGFMFFISCFPMGRYSKWLEGKLATDRR